MKNKKSIIIFLVATFGLVLIITLTVNHFSNKNYNNSVNATNSSYTLAKVAAHANASSCWTIVQADVYDLTSWINNHPGGPETIISMCGKDATTAFEEQHGGQRKPENELKNFKIGTYKQ